MQLARFSLLGFALGIVFRSYIDFGWAFSVFVLSLGFVFGLIWFQRRDHAFLFAFYLLLSAGLGMLRYDYADAAVPLGLDPYVGDRIIITGVLREEPIYKGAQERFVFDADGILENSATSSLRARVRVSLPRYPKHEYGERLLLSGTLDRPKNFREDFDWIAYLSKDDIHYEMFLPKASLMNNGEGNALIAVLFDWKRQFLSAVGKTIPAPEASLGGGLVVGEKAAMPEDLTRTFRRAGISHVVVLSGYNLSVVADGIMRILVLLPRTLAIGTGAVGLLIFALMTNGGASAARAAVMALIALLARGTGRLYEARFALFVAGFLMLIWNPRILVFDISFQLSFLATLGLLYIAPLAEKRLIHLPKWEHLDFRGLAAATISAQIAVFPLILLKMGNFSFVALPVNLLVLPLVPLSMALVALTGVVGIVAGYLALPFAWASYLLLTLEISIARFLASMPFAAIEGIKFSPWLVVLLYTIIICMVWRWRKRDELMPSVQKSAAAESTLGDDFTIEQSDR